MAELDASPDSRAGGHRRRRGRVQRAVRRRWRDGHRAAADPLAAYGEREATGTSLAAIVVIAAVAAAMQGALRQRRPGLGVLSGCPRSAASLAGTCCSSASPRGGRHWFRRCSSSAVELLIP